jgi:hypothetical protein
LAAFWHNNNDLIVPRILGFCGHVRHNRVL